MLRAYDIDFEEQPTTEPFVSLGSVPPPLPAGRCGSRDRSHRRESRGTTARSWAPHRRRKFHGDSASRAGGVPLVTGCRREPRRCKACFLDTTPCRRHPSWPPQPAPCQRGRSVARAGRDRQGPGRPGPVGGWVAGVDGEGSRVSADAVRRRSVGADGEGRRRLRGQAERGQPPSHRVRLRHGAHDPARAGTAGAHEDLDREHPAQERGRLAWFDGVWSRPTPILAASPRPTGLPRPARRPCAIR